MKKKLLIVLFPVILMVAGSLAVWANEQSAMQPGCNKCAQAEEKAPCANCPNAAKMEQRCAKMKEAEAKPASPPGCDKCAKMQPAKPKPCCPKAKPE